MIDVVMWHCRRGQTNVNVAVRRDQVQPTVRNAVARQHVGHCQQPQLAVSKQNKQNGGYCEVCRAQYSDIKTVSWWCLSFVYVSSVDSVRLVTAWSCHSHCWYYCSCLSAVEIQSQLLYRIITLLLVQFSWSFPQILAQFSFSASSQNVCPSRHCLFIGRLCHIRHLLDGTFTQVETFLIIFDYCSIYLFYLKCNCTKEVTTICANVPTTLLYLLTATLLWNRILFIEWFLKAFIDWFFTERSMLFY